MAFERSIKGRCGMCTVLNNIYIQKIIFKERWMRRCLQNGQQILFFLFCNMFAFVQLHSDNVAEHKTGL